MLCATVKQHNKETDVCGNQVCFVWQLSQHNKETDVCGNQVCFVWQLSQHNKETDVCGNQVCFVWQLSQHNKILAELLKPSGLDLYGDQALEFYTRHTAQIEVTKHVNYRRLVLTWQLNSMWCV